jgi:hypothetical protein
MRNSENLETAVLRRSVTRFVFAAVIGGGMAVLPLSVGRDGTGFSFHSAAAFAKHGSEHGGNSGHGGRSGSESGGGGDDHGGRSSRSESGDDHGGRRGRDDRAGDDRHREDDGRHGGLHHVNPKNGAKVEAGERSVEVVNADGTKEEIENGRYELKNAAGRTIVERPATAADRARLLSAGQ